MYSVSFSSWWSSSLCLASSKSSSVIELRKLAESGTRRSIRMHVDVEEVVISDEKL